MYTIATVNPATGKRYDDESAASSWRGLGWLPVVVAAGLIAAL